METFTVAKVSVAQGRGWRWVDPVYGVEILLFRCPYAVFQKETKKRFNVVGEVNADPPAGKTVEHFATDGKRSYLIWVAPECDPRKPRHLNTLVHECTHIAMTALMRRGVNADATHEEPYCYYVGWLTERCYRLLTGRT